MSNPYGVVEPKAFWQNKLNWLTFIYPWHTWNAGCALFSHVALHRHQDACKGKKSETHADHHPCLELFFYSFLQQMEETASTTYHSLLAVSQTRSIFLSFHWTLFFSSQRGRMMRRHRTHSGKKIKIRCLVAESTHFTPELRGQTRSQPAVLLQCKCPIPCPSLWTPRSLRGLQTKTCFILLQNYSLSSLTPLIPWRLNTLLNVKFSTPPMVPPYIF